MVKETIGDRVSSLLRKRRVQLVGISCVQLLMYVDRLYMSPSMQFTVILCNALAVYVAVRFHLGGRNFDATSSSSRTNRAQK
jgi:hypothetical protein